MSDIPNIWVSDTSTAFTVKRTNKQYSFRDIVPSHTGKALSRAALWPTSLPLISTWPATMRTSCSIEAHALARPR